MTAYTYSIMGNSLVATSSLMAASTPALPAARRIVTPGKGCCSRNCLAAPMTPSIVRVLWSARYRWAAVMLQSLRMVPGSRATSNDSAE